MVVEPVIIQSELAEQDVSSVVVTHPVVLDELPNLKTCKTMLLLEDWSVD